MTEPDAYSFRRYLEAKRSVDERALNRHVLDRLQSELRSLASPLRVLEVGVGTGSTVERVASWDTAQEVVEYTGVDLDSDLLEAARARLLEDSAQPTFESGTAGEHLVSERSGHRFDLDLVERDIFEYLSDADRHWDVLIGQAFLDLYDVKPALSRLVSVVDSGGLLYFPITFDGVTILEPPVDPAFDAEIEHRYHTHMDGETGAGSACGDSRAGRHLLSAVSAVGGTILAAGSSDWVVVPDGDGYPADEAYFLHYIIETVRGALDDDPAIDSERFDQWIETRHRQVETNELVYIAHQLDVLCRAPR